MILEVVKKTIAEYDLLDYGDSVLVGLSGGADSVCLTHILYSLKNELNLTLYTAHINHGIRGEEALRDERYVREFSQALGIECFTVTVDVPSIAKARNLSEETVGRQVRYEFFEKICREHNINKLATAHNRNDNAETLLMNFMRGSGINGLCGIPYKRDNIIRPILSLAREDIEKYCKDNSLEYVTDSTNLTEEYTRNKIRHTLIPYIQREFNANFTKTVTDNASLIKEDSKYIDGKALDFYNCYVKNNTVQISDLKKLDAPLKRRVIRYMLSKAYGGFNDISSTYVADILSIAEKSSGCEITLPKNIIAKNEYGKIVLTEKKTAPSGFFAELSVPCDGVTIPQIDKRIEISYADKRENDGAIYLSCEDVDKIIIRSKQNGDTFQPIGLNGTKKVKEYFIDRKIPRDKRMNVPIIEINGKIAAVGSRVDKKFAFNAQGIKIILKGEK